MQRMKRSPRIQHDTISFEVRMYVVVETSMCITGTGTRRKKESEEEKGVASSQANDVMGSQAQSQACFG